MITAPMSNPPFEPPRSAEFRVRRVMRIDEILGRRGKIVEDVLLFQQHSSLMPVLPVFRAAADVGYGEYAAGVEPDAVVCAEEVRALADPVPAITVEQQWMAAIEPGAFLKETFTGTLVPSLDVAKTRQTSASS